MNHKAFYKSRGIFPEISIDKRSQKVFAERRERQLKTFWNERVHLASPAKETAPSASKKSKKYERLQMLYKWKEERKKKLEDAKKNQKPIFKVGVVHKTATGSPLVNYPQCVKGPKKHACVKSVQNVGVVTRAAAKRTGATLTHPLEIFKAQDKFKNKFCKIESGKKQIIDSFTFKLPELVLRLSDCKYTFPNLPKLTENNKSKTMLNNESSLAAMQKKCLNLEKDIMKEIEKPSQPAEKVENKNKLTPEMVLKKRVAPEVVVKKKMTPEVVVKKKMTPEVEVQKKVTPKVEVQKKVMPEVEVQKKVTPKVEVQKKVMPEVEVQKKVMPEVEVQKKVTPEVEVQKKVMPEVEVQKKVTPEKGLDDYQPIHFSPFVTVRNHGKYCKKAKKSLTIEEMLEKEENEFKCRIFSFRKYIQCETKRLLENCDKWEQIQKEFEGIPTDVEGDIAAVIGMTRLLTSDKFMQFKGLIDKCEKGDPYVKVDDLVGFQDWVAIEVEKIDREFNKLEKQKFSNWNVDGIIESKQQKFIPKILAQKPEGKSKIHSHISVAARNLIKESNANGSPVSEFSKLNKATKLTTPKKTPTLLKQVLISEARKKFESLKLPFMERRSSGLEIMIATQKDKLCRPAKESPTKTDSEIFIEENNKPCRSILKKTPKRSYKRHVTFEKHSSKLRLSESYFKPTEDSPDRTVLKDLGNVSSSTRITRSKARLIQNSDSTVSSSPVDPFSSFLQ